MTSGPPLVSVIIPVRNGERYLAEAIESVLAQSQAALEVIVVDDGSTDGSAVIARRFSPMVRCESREHAGVSGALNHGIGLARGALLAFLDADDRWAPDKLAVQSSAIAADPGLDMVFGHVEMFHSPELSPETRARLVVPRGPQPGMSKGAMLVRRESQRRVGGFETAWTVGEFIDWYARAVEHGLRSLMLPDVVLYRRVHDANFTARARDSRQDFVRIVKAALDRRRGARP